MSYKTNLIKMAIKWTPKGLVTWAVNFKLKGIAELTDFNFDIDTRTAYGQVALYGEPEAIEVWLEDFAIISNEDSYQFILHQARSNKPWLANLLAGIVGKTWKIPVPAQFAIQFALVAELFDAKALDEKYSV